MKRFSTTLYLEVCRLNTKAIENCNLPGSDNVAQCFLNRNIPIPCRCTIRLRPVRLRSLFDYGIPTVDPDFVLGSENRDATHLPVFTVSYRSPADRHSQPVSSALGERRALPHIATSRATGAPGHRVTIFLC
jgi:hypothetical protein